MALILKLRLKNIACELKNTFSMLFAHCTDKQVKLLSACAQLSLKAEFNNV